MRVNVRDARQSLAAILDAAAAGDEVLIERYGQAFELRLKQTDKPTHLSSFAWIRARGKPDTQTADERLIDDRER